MRCQRINVARHPRRPVPCRPSVPARRRSGTNPPHGAVVALEEFRTLKPAFVSRGEHLPVPQRSDTTSPMSDSRGQRPGLTLMSLRGGPLWASARECHSRRASSDGRHCQVGEVPDWRSDSERDDLPAPRVGRSSRVGSVGSSYAVAGPTRRSVSRRDRRRGWPAVRPPPASAPRTAPGGPGRPGRAGRPGSR